MENKRQNLTIAKVYLVANQIMVPNICTIIWKYAKKRKQPIFEKDFWQATQNQIEVLMYTMRRIERCQIICLTIVVLKIYLTKDSSFIFILTKYILLHKPWFWKGNLFQPTRQIHTKETKCKKHNDTKETKCHL